MRTCGRSVPQTSPTHMSRLPQEHVGEGGLTQRNVVTKWDKYLEEINERKTEDSSAPRETFTANSTPYSVEELETLWSLTKDADYNNSDPRYLVRLRLAFEEFIDEVEPTPGASARAWLKFVKNFPLGVRMRYLLSLRVAPSTITYPQYDFAEELYTVANQRNRKEEDKRLEEEGVVVKKVVPSRLYPAFLKDSHADVRACLAGLQDLPTPVVELLIQDKNLSVLKALAGNESVPSQFLEKIEQRLTNINNGVEEIHHDGVSTDMVREVLANNVNTPPHMLSTYVLNGRKSPFNKVLEAAYRNPLLPADVKHSETERIAVLIDEKRGLLRTLTREGVEGEQVKRVLNDIEDLEHTKNVAISYGCCAPEELENFITHNVEKILTTPKDEEDGAWGRRNFALENQLGRAISISNLSPSQLGEMYRKLEGEDSVGVIAGIMANPHTPYKTLLSCQLLYCRNRDSRRNLLSYVKGKLEGKFT